jgi:hypothetical protein
MYTQAQIFNLALGALLLTRQITDPTTDKSNENQVLLTHYDVAFRTTLQELDLDSTSMDIPLELMVTNPQDQGPPPYPPYSEWLYIYKYPSKCLYFRRVRSCVKMDNRTTRIPLRIAIYSNGVKSVMTNEQYATGEFIPTDIALSTLIAPAGMAVAFKLAILAAPLISGKGAADLRKEIAGKYVMAKAEAQEQDHRENFNFTEDAIGSEFVEARYS